MKKSSLLFATIFILILIILNACTSNNEEQKDANTNDSSDKDSDFVIGFANGYIGNTWRSQFVDDIEEQAEKYKESGELKDIKIVNTNEDASEQQNQINSLLNEDLDALLIDPVSAESLSSVVNQAKAKGILVVFANDPAAYKGTYNIVGNNDAFWRIQTKWLTEKLEEKGDIVQITGLPGNTADDIRNEAADDELENFPDINVLDSKPGKWSQSEAQEVMSSFLSTYDNIDGILEQDVQAEGVLRAYEVADEDPPFMTGDYTYNFLRKWEELPELESIGVAYAPAHGADALGMTIRLLQGEEFKEDELVENPLDSSLENTIMIDPPYVVTKDGEDDKDAEWAEDLDETEIISLEKALEMGEGKEGSEAMDKIMTEEEIDEYFK